jgi:hypothetical protein
MFRCARIQGLDTTEGLLLFGKEHFYVIDGFTLLKSREIRDIESLPSGAHEPILPSPGSPHRSRAMRQCSKFSYEDIRCVIGILLIVRFPTGSGFEQTNFMVQAFLLDQ